MAAAPDELGTIEVDRQEYVLGDSVEARVSISGLTPLSPGVVALGQMRTMEQSSGVSDGNPAIRTLDKEFVEVAGTEVSADASGSVNERVVLQIPPRSVPSAGLEIQWHVAGVFADGATVESPAFKVLVPRETFLDLLGPPGWSARPSAQHPELRFEVGDRCVRCGDTLDGSLVFTPAKDRRVRDASVRIECLLATDYRTLFKERTEIGGDIEIAHGETREFPFSIPIPRTAGPTAWDYATDGSADGPEAVIEWHLFGKLKTGRLVGSTEIFAPINVYNGP